MTERPTPLLGALVSASSIVTGLILAGLVALGGGGMLGLATVVAGVLSACAYFLLDLHRLPLEVVLLVALIALSSVSLARTALLYARQRRLLARLPLEPVGERHLLAVARRAGVDDLLVMPATRPAAFCFGLARPRVVVTSGLLAQLDADEQEAVVWHEAHHARERGPLKNLVARVAADTFFWMPVLRDLRERYLLVQELAADRLAVRRKGGRALAGALKKAAGVPTPAGAVGLAEFAAARVDRLLDPRAPLPAPFKRRRLVTSALALVGLAFLAVSIGQGATRVGPSLGPMLTSISLHGLPSMALGLGANALLIALVLLAVRRLRRRATG